MYMLLTATTYHQLLIKSTITCCFSSSQQDQGLSNVPSWPAVVDLTAAPSRVDPLFSLEWMAALFSSLPLIA
jgi:hypothetical protein